LERIVIMRCEFCQGSGLAFLPKHVVPCSECGGFGSIQPCDGLRAQPASEPREFVTQLDMAKMFAWAFQCKPRSGNQIHTTQEFSPTLQGWKSLTTDFPFHEANTSLG